MLTPEDIKEIFEVGDYVQVVAEDMPGVPGEILFISKTALAVGPYKSPNQGVMAYGDPVSSETLIPLENINLLFKLRKDGPEDKNS